MRQSTPALEEKRCIIDIASIREQIHKNHILWVPTTEMLADGLTKQNRHLMAKLTRLMEKTVVTLKAAEG